MKKIRFGIVGVGTMGAGHAGQIIQARSRHFNLTAVCDIDAGRAQEIGDTHRVPHFVDYRELVDSGLCDAVIVATPHYWHAPICIYAARKKRHVMCEKPLSSTVGDARAIIAECRKNRVKLGVMLHHRARGIMQKMAEITARGDLGDVFRVHMVCSGWFRTQAYYDSGAWRGTWDGEGGGVLLNQAPHHLDLFQWIGLGLPKRITAMVETREHKIEVEDTANILCDYGDGKVGYIYATTAEQPGMEQLIISGDRGTLKWDGGQCLFGKLAVPISKYLYGCSEAWADAKLSQKCTWKEVTPLKGGGGHIEITKRFVRQIQQGTKECFASGPDALVELEISNAAYLSGYTGKTVDLPVDADAMERLIGKLERERSTGKGGAMRTAARKRLRAMLR